MLLFLSLHKSEMYLHKAPISKGTLYLYKINYINKMYITGPTVTQAQIRHQIAAKLL